MRFLLPLIDGLAVRPLEGAVSAFDGLAVSMVTDDSRQVVSGALFVALGGHRQRGADFMADAIAKGAVALVVAEEDAEIAKHHGVPVLVAASPRQILAELCRRFYQPLPAQMVAVTGTDGKSSVVHFVRSMWEWQGRKAASIGTIGMCGRAVPPAMQQAAALNTTPGVVELYRNLNALAVAGVDAVAMEASSHGLDQRRLDGLPLAAAAFTNLTHDHLDYHGTMEQYFAAKARLFTELLPSDAPAVINAEDAYGVRLVALCGKRPVWRFGAVAGAELELAAYHPHRKGAEVELVLFGKRVAVSVPLVGRFQVMNLLTAMGLLVATGETMDAVVPYLSQAEGVPGRLQAAAETPSGASLLVDYAHTPAALEGVLTTLRAHVPDGRIICVFGCGGDRDATKRPRMGEAASRLADIAILTDDNPRTEDPAAIRASVRAGMAAGAESYEMADRREAIHHAAKLARAGDLVLIAGKGHERDQIIGTTKHPFDDVAVAREAAEMIDA